MIGDHEQRRCPTPRAQRTKASPSSSGRRMSVTMTPNPAATTCFCASSAGGHGGHGNAGQLQWPARSRGVMLASSPTSSTESRGVIPPVRIKPGPISAGNWDDKACAALRAVFPAALAAEIGRCRAKWRAESSPSPAPLGRRRVRRCGRAYRRASRSRYPETVSAIRAVGGTRGGRSPARVPAGGAWRPQHCR